MNNNSSMRASAKALADHLISPENEKVTVKKLEGVYSNDVHGALAEFQAISKGSRAKKFLYHVSVSPAPDQVMTEKDWDKVWAIYDKVHDLNGLQYVEVEHIKLQRVHRHRVYNRLDPLTGKARCLSWTKIKNEKAARIMEDQLGHPFVNGKFTRSIARDLRQEGMDSLASKLQLLSDQSLGVLADNIKELNAKKRGKPIDITRAILADIWNCSDSAIAFQEALSNAGFTLAQGTKVPIIISESGDEIPLLRNINVGRKNNKQAAIKKAELMTRLPGALPDVKSALNNRPVKRAIVSTAKSYPKQGALSSSPTTRPNAAWYQKRQQKFRQAYQIDVPVELIRYWRFAQTHQGQIWLNNKFGVVIDHGDRIETRASGKGIGVCAEATVKLALAKGWTTAKVTGSDDYKIAVMEAASRHGLEIDLTDPVDQQLWDAANVENEPKQALDESNSQDEHSCPESPVHGPTVR